MYKLIVMPKRVSEEQFINDLLEIFYFGVSVSQRDHILLTAADLMQCTTGSGGITTGSIQYSGPRRGNKLIVP